MVDTRGVVRLGMPSNEKPKMGELNRFLTEYCTLWKYIGYKLGLEDVVLDMIQSDCPTRRERFTVVLQKWLELDAKPTWNTLELAITNARREEQNLESIKEMPIQRVENEDGHKTQGENANRSQSSILTLIPDRLSVHFSTFVMAIRKSLENRTDKLEACKEICSNLTISGNSDVLLFNNEQITKINNCLSFKELFLFLRQYWSWKEYSILEAIIAECDSQEANAELEKFEKLMSTYCGMKLISDKYSPSELPKNYVNLSIIVDKPYKNLTLENFVQLRDFIFEHLDVHRFIALPFIKFLFSSLHLEWCIPVQAVSHVIKMANMHKESFISKLITLIQVGNKTILDVQEKEIIKFNLLNPYFSAGEESKTIWTCLICCQLFKKTRYLPCHHFFCEECLNDIQEQSKITCPECRREAVVPEGGVKSLPNNFFNHVMDKLILKYKWRDETEIKQEDCGACDPVVAFCTNCAKFLCNFCQESHKYSKSCSGHVLVPLSQLRSDKNVKTEVLTCQKHNLGFDYYCEKCRVLVCDQCVIDGHLDHECDTVEKSASRYRNKLQKSTETMEKVMLKNLVRAQDDINEMRKLIADQSDGVNQDIDQYYDGLIQKLLEQKEQLKQCVRDTVLQKEEALTQQLKEVEHTQAEVLSVKELSDTITKRCCDEEALSTRNQMAILMKKLNDNFKRLHFHPVESANVKVTYIKDIDLLQKFAQHFATIDSLSFEVENPVLESVQQGDIITLEVIAKDYNGDYYCNGGSQVSACLKPSSGEVTTVHVEDNSNGSYTICFEAQQVGEMQLSVFAGGRQIEGSPFNIYVQKNQTALDKPSRETLEKGDGSVGQPWSFAYSDNDLWAVADWTKNCVHVFDDRDQLIETFGSQGDGDGEFQYPRGVAFDCDNALYVTDSHNHRVQKFDSLGNYLLQFGTKGAGKGQLNYPVGIATCYNKVYIADRQNHRVSVFRTDGQFCYSMGKENLSRYFDVTIVNSQLQVADWSHHCVHTFTLDGHYCGNFATKVQRKAA